MCIGFEFGPGPEVIKLFFMLKSAEQEIYPAQKHLLAWFIQHMRDLKQDTSLFSGVFQFCMST